MDTQTNAPLEAALAAAGLQPSPDRIEILAASLERVSRIIDAMAAVDYGTIEPASRFRPAPRRPS